MYFCHPDHMQFISFKFKELAIGKESVPTVILDLVILPTKLYQLNNRLGDTFLNILRRIFILATGHRSFP